MNMRKPPDSLRRGFSLLELMVSISILLVVMVVLLQITGAIGEIWKSTSGKISAFQNARSAFATITNTLSRATLNTYNDYVDASNNYRTAETAATFTPVQFLRASELHFISGPVWEIIPGGSTTPAANPGHAVLFQAPMGVTDDPKTYGSLNRTLNSVGFYVQYAKIDSSILPSWLPSTMTAEYRFRLVEIVEPTENLRVYTSTATTTGGTAPKPKYDPAWTEKFRTPYSSGNPRARVLAEDVCLLLLRPRLAPKDEESAATYLKDTAPVAGAVLSPNYHYDSRAWIDANYPPAGYPPLGGSMRVRDTTYPSPLLRKELMRNQVPPIVEVIMVSLDRRSLSRFKKDSPTPPAELQVPPTLFKTAKDLETDLATYTGQLSNARIRYKVFRTSVDIQGSKWSN